MASQFCVSSPLVRNDAQTIRSSQALLRFFALMFVVLVFLVPSRELIELRIRHATPIVHVIQFYTMFTAVNI